MKRNKILWWIFGIILLVCFLNVGCSSGPSPPGPSPPGPQPPVPPPLPVPAPEAPFIGTSFYQLQVESAENIIWFIAQLREHGANATEIFLNFDWPLSAGEPWQSYPTSGWRFSPYKITGLWSEDKFGDYQFPTFDLEKWNPDIWNRLKLIFTECQKNGIAVFIRIHDYCSLKTPFSKRHYPYNNGSNVQHYTGGVWGEPIQAYYRLFNQKLMATIHEAGLKYFFLIAMNEADVLGDDWPGGELEKDVVCKAFHQFYINNFMARGVKKKEFVINIDRPNVRQYFKDEGYRIEYHGINSPKRMQECFDKYGNGAFPNGDGPDPYALGLASYNGNREASYEQGIEMGKMGNAINGFGFIYYNRNAESLSNSGSVRLAKFTALDGLIEGWK